MALTQLAPPYPVFTDKNGDPLDAGFIYFGEPNLNPETNPIQVYYDRGFTQPAAQPLRTSNGYVMRNGSPALIYADSQFSVTVRDKNNALVIYSPVGFGVVPSINSLLLDNAARDVPTLLADTQFTYASGVPNTTQVVAGDILRTLEEGFAYEVAADDATDQHVTTAGGVKLYVVQGEIGFNVKAFGATGDGVTDDSDAVEAAILAAYNSATPQGTRRRGACVYLPKGRYRIAQSGKLFSSLPTVTGGAGSFHFEGDGPNDSYADSNGATIISFDPPTSATSEYLINNNAKITFSKFYKIGFVSQNGGTFWNGPVGSGVQSFEFYTCGFYGFTDIFNVGGTSNNSEWSFFGCKFSAFSGRAFYLNNEQAVNWRFFGCDAEVFTGTLFEYEKGANVAWFGGSIIPNASTSRILKVPSTASSGSFGQNNAPHLKFDSVRFEMRNAALFSEKIQPVAGFNLICRDCGMGGFNIPTSPSITPVLYWRGAGAVLFEKCVNLTNYLWDHSVDGSAANQDLTVTLKDCANLSGTFISNSTFAITTSASNVARKPLFKISGTSRQLDGEFHPGANASRDCNATRRAIQFGVEAGLFDRKNASAGWPQTTDLILPPVLLQKIEFYPIATSAFGGSATVQILVKNAAGSTLATIGWTMAAPGATVFAFDVRERLTSTNNYLRFEFSSSVGGSSNVPFLGDMILTY